MTRPVVHLPDDLADQIIDHCLEAAPNEGCGLFAMDGERVVKVYPTPNLDDSPVSYTVPPEEHLVALNDAESNGWALGGVFHSHPNGAARPSMIDVSRALDPEWVYLVVGMLGGRPEIRGWELTDGTTTEIQLEI